MNFFKHEKRTEKQSKHLQAFIDRTFVNAIATILLAIRRCITFRSRPFALAYTFWMSGVRIQLTNGSIFAKFNARILRTNKHLNVQRKRNGHFEQNQEKNLKISSISTTLTLQSSPAYCAVQLQYALFWITWQVPPFSHRKSLQSLVGACELSPSVSHRIPE